MNRLIPAVALAALLTATANATPTLSLLPSSGTASGAPGAVVGWGFDFGNTYASDWVVLDDSFVTGSLSTGTYGNYVDYVVNQFYVVNPSSSLMVDFNQSTGNGTGEFDIAKYVPPVQITGNINIDYSVFSQNPNDPNFDPASFVTNGTAGAAAAVQVTPEPAPILLLGVALLALLLARAVTE